MKEKGEKKAGGEQSPEEKKGCEGEKQDKALLGQSKRQPTSRDQNGVIGWSQRGVI